MEGRKGHHGGEGTGVYIIANAAISVKTANNASRWCVHVLLLLLHLAEVDNSQPQGSSVQLY